MTIPPYDEWKRDLDITIQAYDDLIKLLQMLRDSMALRSYPSGFNK